MPAQDTTATALKWFLLAMILYPETAAPARAELERVVGDRPPSFADMDRLPQIEAMVKELLRWRPPVAGGIVHMATEDIIYEEYLIPKGAMLLPIAWSICHDPSVYPNGDTFDPSRFVDTAGNVKSPLPHTHEDYLAFGHGRRICIGKSLAINSLLISIAHLLWAFDFRKGVDEHGVEVTPDPMAFLDNGATVFPKPFPVKFVPRIPGLAERLKAVPSK
ncbi:cytochrome P450 [Calocera viscosa TUFC12733]|uniref:Cytochrome P450 n=1 Tax=Calocera viscosa (strain TUFC12733) TaxID=1330018 RepID=A0A167RNU6_CALVF|nr:cytochrome P450 [Calocera viscosa TUFC12733]